MISSEHGCEVEFCVSITTWIRPIRPPMWLQYVLLLWAIGALLVMLILYAYGEQNTKPRSEA